MIPSSEDEMILAFLQAESRSPRFSALLARKAVEQKLLFRPNLGDATENEVRRSLLSAYRGYGWTKLFIGHVKGRWLFKKFPKDVQWFREILSAKQLGKCLYLNHAQWKQLSGGKRLVSEGAKNVNKIYVRGVSENIFDVLKALIRGEILPEIIICQTKSGKRVLLEGHTRATAHVVRGTTEIPVLIGYSKSMNTWAKQEF